LLCRPVRGHGGRLQILEGGAVNPPPQAGRDYGQYQYGDGHQLPGLYTASVLAKGQIDGLLQAPAKGADRQRRRVDEANYHFDVLVLSQRCRSIRHTQLLYRAMCDVGTPVSRWHNRNGQYGAEHRHHSEDKPSAMLMTKTAVAFAHTG
jgi:hypothetical protein